MTENQRRDAARQEIFEGLTDEIVRDAFPEYTIWIRVLKSFEWQILKYEASIQGNHFEMAHNYLKAPTPSEIKEQTRWFIARCIFREQCLNESISIPTPVPQKPTSPAL